MINRKAFYRVAPRGRLLVALLRWPERQTGQRPPSGLATTLGVVHL